MKRRNKERIVLQGVFFYFSSRFSNLNSTRALCECAPQFAALHICYWIALARGARKHAKYSWNRINILWSTVCVSVFNQDSVVIQSAVIFAFILEYHTWFSLHLIVCLPICPRPGLFISFFYSCTHYLWHMTYATVPGDSRFFYLICLHLCMSSAFGFFTLWKRMQSVGALQCSMGNRWVGIRWVCSHILIYFEHYCNELMHIILSD